MEVNNHQGKERKMALKTGTVANSYRDYIKYPEGFRLMKEHGFDCADFREFSSDHSKLYDYSDEELAAYLREVRKAADEAGIEINQAHALWKWPLDDEYKIIDKLLERNIRMLRASKILGISCFIIHPMFPYGVYTDKDKSKDSEIIEINRKFFNSLADEGEKEGITICLENLPFPDELLSRPEDTVKFVEEMNHPFLKICLDTGHSTVCSVSPDESVRMMGKNLAALHVHTNDGADDKHWPPFEPRGIIDWDRFRDALKEVGYTGVISLEQKDPDNAHDDIDAYHIDLAKQARYIAE